MTKLCPRGKAAAKRKFKVYPSAMPNAYASKICAGKIKDPSGVKKEKTSEDLNLAKLLGAELEKWFSRKNSYYTKRKKIS